MAKKRTLEAVISPQEVACLLRNPEKMSLAPILQKEALWDSSSTSSSRALLMMQGMERIYSNCFCCMQTFLLAIFNVVFLGVFLVRMHKEQGTGAVVFKNNPFWISLDQGVDGLHFRTLNRKVNRVIIIFVSVLNVCNLAFIGIQRQGEIRWKKQHRGDRSCHSMQFVLIASIPHIISPF